MTKITSIKRFLVQWTEEVTFNCAVEIEANSEAEAIEKWRNDEFEDYDRDEANNRFEQDSVEAKEIRK